MIDGADQIGFIPFRFFSQAGPDKDRLSFRMKGLYGPAAGNHRRYGSGNIRQELVIELFNHSDPHGAAAARQLELIFTLNVAVEFQGFF